MRFAAVLFLVLVTAGLAQQEFLQSGPMVGRSDMMEVELWVQTNAPADVRIQYWEKGTTEPLFETAVITTSKEQGFTAHLIADEVQPSKVYEYAVFINDEKLSFDYPLEFQSQVLWKWRSDPPEFSFVTGSGFYINDEPYDRPGKPYGGDYEIMTSIYDKQPDFMIWLGDNVYYREADWHTRTGMIYRNTHGRSLPELQPLLANTHHYAIWDDHDYGPNDSDRSWWNKNTALDVFKMFWANPGYGIGDMKGAITFFEWGDAEFFLLDNRWYRTPNDRKFTDRVMLGDEQVEWLIDALDYSKAAFKIVVIGGQLLNPVPWFENHATYPEERAAIISAIEEEDIEGVLFLTGDRHHSEITKMERKGTYPLYEITVSPFTSGPHDAEDEPNFLRVKGTQYGKRNFGIFEFTGTKENRKMTVSLYDVKGEFIWDYVISADELKNN